MSSLPTWAVWSIVVPLVLISPVIAFLLAIAAESLIWAVVDGGAPALTSVGAWAGGLLRLAGCGRDRGMPLLAKRKQVRAVAEKEPNYTHRMAAGPSVLLLGQDAPLMAPGCRHDPQQRRGRNAARSGVGIGLGYLGSGTGFPRSAGNRA